jgi:hypothetical protein
MDMAAATPDPDDVGDKHRDELTVDFLLDMLASLAPDDLAFIQLLKNEAVCEDESMTEAEVAYTMTFVERIDLAFEKARTDKRYRGVAEIRAMVQVVEETDT